MGVELKNILWKLVGNEENMKENRWPEEFYEMNVTDISQIELVFKELNGCVFESGSINTVESWIDGIASLVKTQIYKGNLDGNLSLAKAYDIYFDIQKAEFSKGMSSLVDKGLMSMEFDGDFQFELTDFGKQVAQTLWQEHHQEKNDDE